MGNLDELVYREDLNRNLTPNEVDQNFKLLKQAIEGDKRIVFLSSEGCISDADISLGSSTFGTDNTARIQNVLNLASLENPLLLYWDGRYSVTGLNIKSYTTIICLEGCGAILRDNSNKALLSNANAIPVSMPGVFPDTNIKISGGIWNGNGYRGGVAMQLHSPTDYGFVTGIRMYGVQDVFFEKITILNTRTYACLFFTSRNVTVNDMTIYQGDNVFVNQDGLDFDGFQDNIKVNGLRAKCGDDAITLNTTILKNGVDAGDYTVYFGKFGPATNIDFQNLYFDSSQMGIRILSGNQLVDNVSIRNIRGICQAYWLIIDNYLQSPSGVDDAGPGNVGRILIENISVKNLTGTAYGGNFAKASVNCNVKFLTIRNYTRNDFVVDKNPSFMVKGINTKVENLFIENYYSLDDQSNYETSHIVMDGASVDYLKVSGYTKRVASTNESPFISILNGASIKKLVIDGATCINSSNLLINTASINNISACSIIHESASVSSEATFKTTSIINDIVLSNYFGYNQTDGSFTSKRGDGFIGPLPQPTEKGIYAYWKFDESSGNAIDSTPNSITLLNTNGVSYVSGKINNGVSFSGNNYLTAEMRTSTEEFTYNFWFNMTSFSGVQMLISNEERAANQYGLSVYTNGSESNNKIYISLGSGTTHLDILVDKALNINTWYMMTITYSNSEIKCYIDDEMILTRTGIPSIGSNLQNRFRIGAEAGAAPLYFYFGKIDELGFWNKIISESEILNLYNNGNGKSYPF